MEDLKKNVLAAAAEYREFTARGRDSDLLDSIFELADLQMRKSNGRLDPYRAVDLALDILKKERATQLDRVSSRWLGEMVQALEERRSMAFKLPVRTPW